MPPPTGTKIIELLTATTAGLSNTAQAVESVQIELRNQGTLLHTAVQRQGVLESELAAFREELRRLLTTVRDGNGQPSLLQRVGRIETQLDALRDDGQPFVMARITVLETQQKQTASDLSEGKATIDELRKLVDSAQTAKVMSRGQIIAAIVSAVIVAGMSLWSVVAQLMANKP